MKLIDSVGSELHIDKQIIDFAVMVVVVKPSDGVTKVQVEKYKEIIDIIIQKGTQNRFYE